LEKYDKTPRASTKILDTFVGMGKIDVARVYTGWGVFASLIPFAVDMGYEVVFVYAHRSGSVVKNMADMQITVDALKLGYERTVLMPLCLCPQIVISYRLLRLFRAWVKK